MMQKAFLFTLLATPAFATCPVPGDLAGGIYIVQDDGEITNFWQDGDLFVETTRLRDSEDGYEYRSRSVLFLTEYTELENGEPVEGSGETIAYTKALPDVSELVGGFVWQGRVVTTFGSDRTTEIENYTLSVGPLRDIKVAGCTYAAHSVGHMAVVMEPDFYFYAFGQDYIPSLGIAIPTGYFDFQSGLDMYETLSITTTHPPD